MIFECTSWEDAFFQKFISISHRNYLSHPDYIKESLNSFQEMLGTNAPFNQRNDWKAWIIIENDQVVGRVFASTRVDEFKQNHFLPFGYFEADSYDIATLLFEAVEKFSQEKNYNVIRGPIAGNVFNSSRFITKQTRRLFLGEPLHKKIYIQYFERYGFVVSQKWLTGYFDIKQRILGMYRYLKVYKKSHYRKINYNIRHLDLNCWDEELKLFYDLMMDSYSVMDDVELITFDEFRVWNENLKHLVQEKNCLILEHQGQALGFLISLRNRRREIARLSKKASFLNKIIFGFKQKFSLGLLLMNHVGKRRGAEDEIKGVSIKLFTKMARLYHGFIFTPAVFGFMSENSKSMEIVSQKYHVSSEYCMFQKYIKY